MRSRGSVQRTHIITKTSTQPLRMKTTTLITLPTLTTGHGQAMILSSSLPQGRTPVFQPPRKSSDGDAADGEHGAVLGHEEERPAQAAVFGVEAGDQFALGLGQVERGALALAVAQVK